MLKEDALDSALARRTYYRVLAGDSDPVRAGELLGEPWLPDDGKDVLLTTVARRMFVEDPEAALGWLDGLPGQGRASQDMYTPPHQVL